MSNRILIVEDDPGIQDSIQLALENEGYRVQMFPGGEPILEMNFEIPDIFLLDKQLNGVDGLDVCRFIKTQPDTVHVPVIMYSASPQLRGVALEAGASAFLEKPFRVRQLLDILRRYLPSKVK